MVNLLPDGDSCILLPEAIESAAFELDHEQVTDVEPIRRFRRCNGEPANDVDLSHQEFACETVADVGPRYAVDRASLRQTVKKGAGLDNLGNTCFLNSVLQCLTYTEPLVAYLESGKHHNSSSLPWTHRNAKSRRRQRVEGGKGFNV